MLRTRFLLLLGLTALLGCTPSGPPLTPVSGTITLDDKPFAEARVMFIPQGQTQGHGGDAMSDADGKYQITAHRTENRKGLLPGEYKVVISRLRQSDGTPLPPGAKPIESDARETTPEPYCSARNTPFFFTIGVDGQVIDLPLKSK